MSVGTFSGCWRFLAEFLSAGERGIYFEDFTGELLLISDALLRERSGKMKADKRGRGRYLRLLADTIRNPQEIRLERGLERGRIALVPNHNPNSP